MSVFLEALSQGLMNLGLFCPLDKWFIGHQVLEQQPPITSGFCPEFTRNQSCWLYPAWRQKHSFLMVCEVPVGQMPFPL